MTTPHRVRACFSFRLRWRLVALALALGALCSVPSFAQTPPTAPRIYRLATSTFQKGCFAPCMCPVMWNGTVQGTFVLTADGSDGLFEKYVVNEVNWIVKLPDGEVRITGSGTYRVGGAVAIQQQLSLDLKVGADPVQHFDSGLVAGGGDFPRIAITVSIHGQYCFDTVIGLDASPVPSDEIHLHRLLRESSFQQACTGPCACAPGPLQRIRGTFSLVEMEQDPLFAHYAIASANWQVSGDAATGASGHAINGSGFYRVGGEVAIQQQMSLELKIDDQAPAAFDSGLVSGGGAFPRIDIPVTSTEAGCVTTTIDLHTSPGRQKTAEPTTEELAP
jgi:hypothetical protein